ncbi:nuclear transport factor 2 family protein [Actinospica durhamensis]|uniref:Nuclear transport factor 2 family protein n=1 Tax=Actinospica durhamensis TaxID=1508375 RepID=A0A941IV04_9ACTN|nr:nuclear transport factor 2 family protein [Actinospica durhamensis]MBR7838348.1 nuclear transport factor 2 family protein [Actinospica durhamensis]
MSVPTTRTPRETIEQFLHTVVHGTRDELADFYTPDVRIEIPFAPGGVPQVSEGREEIRARMKGAEAMWSFDSVQDVTVHTTGEPDVVIAEYRVHGTLAANGRAFSLGYISVFRVEDGLVAWARDYGNPLEVGELTKELGM